MILLCTQIVVHMIIRIRRMLDLWKRMLLQLLHDDFNGLFQLRVAALPPGGGFEINFHIGSDAVVFHFPIAVDPINRRSWCGHSPSINQFRISPDADESSPCSLANERSDSILA